MLVSPQVIAFSLNYHNIYFQKESQENSAEKVPVRAAEICGSSTREAFFNYGYKQTATVLFTCENLTLLHQLLWK